MKKSNKRPSVKKSNDFNLSNIEYTSFEGRRGNKKEVNMSKYKRDADNSSTLVSRRKFIYGAIGAGVLAVGAAGTKFVSDKVTNNTTPLNVVNPKKSNIISQDQFSDLGNNTFMSITREINLDYGSLVWANSSDTICALIPTNVAKPLTVVDIINSNSGNQKRVIDKPVSLKEGYDIYDVRANDDGIIWTEVNILQEEWRIYASAFNGDYDLNPVLIDIGNNNWETPTIAIAKNNIFWQINPKSNGDFQKLNSCLKSQNLKSLSKNDKYVCKNVENNEDIESDPHTVKSYNGRMITPLYSYNDGVIICPRADSSLSYYRLTYINNSFEEVDSLILPQSIKPLEAGYGKTGFNFSLDAIYNTTGFSNIGTYTPTSKSSDYNSCEWFNFSRNPTAAPCWCNNLFIIRSTMAICAINLENKSYCVLDRPNNSEDYGEYLASSGICSKIVTYSNIHDQPVSGEEKKYNILRIWEQI